MGPGHPINPGPGGDNEGRHAESNPTLSDVLQGLEWIVQYSERVAIKQLKFRWRQHIVKSVNK